MNLEQIPVSRLNPAPYNPRRQLTPGDPAWVKLERSLDEFDLVQPIVWNRRTGHVVSGHQRLEILKHRGVEAVDCVVVDLSLEREQALNVTLNNASVGSDWDAGKLVDLLGELQLLPDFDVTLTGFDDQQLADLLLTPACDEDASTGESATTSGLIEATLEIPAERWCGVRAELDALLEREPDLRLHVTNLPANS